MSCLTPHMKDLCNIEQMRTTQGSMGGNKTSYQSVSTGVSCLVQEVSSSQSRNNDKHEQTRRFEVMFDQDRGVSKDMRLYVTQWEGDTANPFYIKITNTGSSGKPGEKVAFWADGYYMLSENQAGNPAT